MGIYDVPPQELINKTAQALKADKSIQPPAWATFVKTGISRERPPAQADWWYTRAASILYRLAKCGPVGVAKLRNKYGGRKRRGVEPNMFVKSSGNILRKILQQLEKAGLAQQSKNALNKGRVATGKGVAFLSKQADELMKTHNVTIPARPTAELKIIEVEKPKKARAPRKPAAPKAAAADGAAPEAKKPRAPRKKAAQKKEAEGAEAPAPAAADTPEAPAAQ